MARAATAGELADLRKDAQFSQVYVAIRKPTAVFAARVNQTFTTFDGVTEITFDGVTTGAYTAVLTDMTLYVGSTAGAHLVRQLSSS